MSWLILSDLDGTLLDHHSYDFSPAVPAMQRLLQAGHKLVINTSKTCAEVMRFNETLELNTPFVVENGAALHDASGQLVQSFGVARSEILQRLDTLSTEPKPYLGFQHASLEQIRAWTGLDTADAQRAKHRAWSEPLHWQGDDQQLHQMQQALASHGLRILRGGRFVHVQGQHDKASVIQPLKQQLNCQYCLALGDGANDVAMLQAADIAVQVRSPAHDFPKLGHPQLLQTRECGPHGWNQAINTLLDNNRLNP